MRVVERRLDVRLISAAALAQYMTYREMSVRELATRVGCSHSTIGHLRSGKRSYIDKDWAKKIEKVLDAPRGSLFMAELSSVTRDVAPKGRVA